MRKTKSFAAALAAAVGMLLASPVTASTASTASTARPASTGSTAEPAQSEGYTYTEYDLQGTLPDGYETFGGLDFYSTNDENQIWINGKVNCWVEYDWTYSWCGVGGGNGTAVLNTGINLVAPGRSWYFRVDAYANGAGCYAWGSSNLKVWNSDCEDPGGGDSVQRAPTIVRRLPRVATLHLATGTVYETHLPPDSVYVPPGMAIPSLPGAGSRPAPVKLSLPLPARRRYGFAEAS